MLERIVADTRGRLEQLRPMAADIEARAAAMPPPPDFVRALTAPGLSVIAEVKRRSPSRGQLAADLDPVLQSKRYVDGGAAAISILTEPDHFGGSNADLEAVRSAVEVPTLRKDFTLDPLQIWEAKAIGASAVLLIVAILDDETLALLHDVARQAGLAALVEVHSETEAERALDVGADIVGVNNRDLTTFETDLGTAERIAPMLSSVPVTVGESGIGSRSDADRMAAAGYDAVLVGESLVRSSDPAALLEQIRAAR
jgi:indole-3-glycerol phosphate synthase